LKEKNKMNNWKQNKERVGAYGNPILSKMGEGLTSRFNLGGAGGGLNRQGNELA
jgi:hypothetical protein